MLVLSIAQFVVTLFLAVRWEEWSVWSGRSVSFLILMSMTVYNIIVVSHLFTHTPLVQLPIAESTGIDAQLRQHRAVGPGIPTHARAQPSSLQQRPERAGWKDEGCVFDVP